MHREGEPGTGSRSVEVEALTRVEGEGGLRVEIEGGRVVDVALSIFEPPRYFEALLRGRKMEETPDITARICGICPVAYQLSSCAAVESACEVEVGERIARLRRLLYCGEWIQSHALHAVLLHAPDFRGCRDAVELAEREPEAVARGLRLKRAGNRLMEVVGGRAVHPVNVRVGGFWRAPAAVAVHELVAPLRAAREDALATLAWASGFDFPEVTGSYRHVALRQPGCYAIEAGRVTSSEGMDTTPAGFAELVVEEHVPRSTALHARLGGRDSYLTGPLARYALNRDLLGDLAAGAARDAGLQGACTNPFRSILVRCVELVEACDQAVRLAESYAPPEPAAVAVAPRAGRGFGATEAPRGLLLIGYEIDAEGIVRWARIVPPTAQNQLVIEEDLWRVAEAGLELDQEQLTQRCEQAVRNHDPCISCSAHFLRLELARRP